MMNKREENKYTMYNTVQAVLGDNRQIVDTVPLFAESVDEFNETLQTIGGLDNHYQSVSDGATAAKYAAKDALIDVIMQVSGPTSVYARRSKDENLLALSQSAESLYRYILRDTELLHRARLVASRISELQSELEPYGVTAERVNALNAAIEGYAEALGGRESKAASAVAARGGLSKAMDEADEILKEEIDAFMGMFKQSQPAFSDQYWAARVIKDS